MRICNRVFVVVLLVLSYPSQAQTATGLPVQFIQFFKTYSLVNPSSMAKDSSLEMNVGDKSLLGAFNGVRTFYAYGHAQLNKRKPFGSKQVLGLTFMNDREGSYINRNRVSLMYAFHLPISERMTVHAGVAVGVINYFFKASNISAGGSAFAPNADLGLWLHRADFNVGISGNQLIPSTLTPIDQTYTVARYYTFIADKTFIVGPYFLLTPAFTFRWEPTSDYTTDVALVALVQDNLTMALAYKVERGVSVSAGLEKIKLGQSLLKMMVSYFTPIGRVVNYNPNAYEVSLGFIPGRKRVELPE